MLLFWFLLCHFIISLDPEACNEESRREKYVPSRYLYMPKRVNRAVSIGREPNVARSHSLGNGHIGG